MIGKDGRARNGLQISQVPSVRYKIKGWNGRNADWLGKKKGKKKRPEFLPYEEAKKVVNALGLRVGMIVEMVTERPPNIPKQSSDI